MKSSSRTGISVVDVEKGNNICLYFTSNIIYFIFLNTIQPLNVREYNILKKLNILAEARDWKKIKGEIKEKYQLCGENGVDVFYVNYNDDVNEKIREFIYR